MTQSTSSNPAKARSSIRMAAVGSTVKVLRALFEVEREIVRCLTTFIYRVGDIELKYLLCQHVWESAGHARFIRERGNELGGFGKIEAAREEIRRIFEESIRVDEEIEGLAAFYRVIKGELLSSYRKYLDTTHSLADWPSRKLVAEFIQDEERHQAEIQPYTGLVENTDWVQRLQLALDFQGGWLGALPKAKLPNDFNWRWPDLPYRHPDTCNRGDFPKCSSVFGYDPGEFPICRDWLEDPKTDARVIRLMVYVWLMMELDAVDYLSTVFYETPEAPFDLHYDLARHLWDESRHSAFGYRQLPKLGVDLMTLEHSVSLYNILVQMTPPERYAMMTMEFEAGSFGTKAYIMDRVRELSDFEADTLLAFDRNDEQQHVRYGHRWLPVIMGLFGIDEPVDTFVEATQKRFQELEKTYGEVTPHSLTKEERFTANKLLKLAGIE